MQTRPTTTLPRTALSGADRSAPADGSARPPAFLTALLFLLLGLAPGVAGDLAAQGHPQERDGFWIGAGLGYGSLGIEELPSREDGLSGNLSLGGTISERFLLGVGTTGWTKEVDGVRFTFGTLALMARLYPDAEGGFFVNLGLGGGQVSVSYGNTTVSESGGGAILGLGYDARMGPAWSLTPYVNAIGYSIDGDQADVLQFGLGVTWH